MPQPIKLNKGLLVLIAMLLAFVLLVVVIWFWYNVKMASLDKQPSTNNTIHLNQ